MIDEQSSGGLDEVDCIENFKMARRCTIKLPFTCPRILESYADYFIAGAYKEKPFQVNIYDRSKTNIVQIDVGRELRRIMQRHAVANGQIVSLDHIIVPRLKWSDRHHEKFEQKKRVVVTMDQKDGPTAPGQKTLS